MQIQIQLFANGLGKQCGRPKYKATCTYMEDPETPALNQLSSGYQGLWGSEQEDGRPLSPSNAAFQINT